MSPSRRRRRSPFRSQPRSFSPHHRKNVRFHRQEEECKGDARLRAASEVFQGRLSALSTAHNILVRDRWSPASLTQIVRDVVKPHSGADERVRIEGPDVTIPPKTAITLALAVHELCTNAAKYGALSTPGGEVHIGWDVMREDGQVRLRMKWVERGGPPVTPPARRGFGTRMIERGLARSEEHTSELQSLMRISYAVFCVKKK